MTTPSPIPEDAMTRHVVICLVAACFAACSTSSGVVPSGKDTWLISRSEKGIDKTGSRVKAAVFQEASEFCSARGKTIEVMGTSRNPLLSRASGSR